MVLGFFWGSFLLWKVIRMTAYKEEDVFDGLFWALTGGFIFGRFTYIILNFDKFGFDLLKYILINGYPGMTIYGSLIGAIVALFAYFSAKKIKFIDIADYWIAPCFLAFGFGKLGGFLNLGRWYELGESAMFFIGTFIAYRLLMEIRKEKLGKGFVFYFFIWYFSLTYLIFDKTATSRIYFLGLSLNTLMSILLVLTLSFYFLYYFRSLIFSYAKKTVQTIHHSAKTKIRRGKREV
jgi:hypothetical protein